MSNPRLLKAKNTRVAFQVITVSILLIALFIRVVPHSSTQTPTEQWIKWQMTVQPISGEIKAEIIIELYEPNEDEQILVDEVQRDLQCLENYGNKPIVQGNEMLFDGRSYLLCHQPDIYEIVREEWGLHLENMQFVNVSDFFARADVTFAPAEGELPIVHTTSYDTKFSLIAKEDEVTSMLAFIGGWTQSQNPRLLECNHGEVLVEHSCPNGEACTFNHHVDEDVTGSEPTTIEEITLNVSGQYIYIGYNPASNAYFRGRMQKVEWDPYAPGTGVNLRLSPPKTCGDAYWTDWLNRDSPSGTGDFETTAAFEPAVCRDGIILDMEARADQLPPFAYGDSTVQTLRNFNPIKGLECNNADQADGQQCHDYEVRFLCQPFDEEEEIEEYESTEYEEYQ